MKNSLAIKIIVATFFLFSSILLKGLGAVDLIGINSDSQLVTFDPYTSNTVETHVRLNPNEYFYGLAYDKNHNIIYAFSSRDNLYTIDPITLAVQHLGNIYTEGVGEWGSDDYWYSDASTLVYNPIENALYTSIIHGKIGGTDFWSQIAEVDLDSLRLINKFDLEYIVDSLSFNEEDNQLYGIQTYDVEDNIHPARDSHIVKINPVNGNLTDIFETPYHSIYGLAKEDNKNIYYSWVNEQDGHFYSKTDLENMTFTRLADSIYPPVVDAVLYKNFFITSKQFLPLEVIPVKFNFNVRVTSVYDSQNLLNNEVAAGDIISGQFYYDVNDPYKPYDYEENPDPLYGVNIVIGGRTISFDNFGCWIQNNYYNPNISDTIYDSFNFSSSYFDDLKYIDFRLIDHSASALLNNDKLPEKFDLSAWDENSIYISEGEGWDEIKEDYGPSWTIVGVVDEIIAETDGDNCPNDPNKTEPGICGCGVADTDTDSDGTADCIDNCLNDPNKVEPGICGCGIADTDSDGDGIPDCNDVCDNSIDSDGDGTDDCNDKCPIDPNKTKRGICGCGIADTDSDGDGTADCNDNCPNDPNKTLLGACGCGIPDIDTDSDGTPDCIDNCPSDPNKTRAGICGCGIADSDSDGDGIADCNDNCDNSIDSDGDGLNDCDDLCSNDPNKIRPGTCGCDIADTDSDKDGMLDCMDSNDDDDGLPDGEEQGPDRNNQNYDGNGDGIPDHLQGNVASFHTFNSQNYVTLETPAGTLMRNCIAKDNPSKSDTPSYIEFPFGFFEFSIEGIAPGGSSTATMYLPAGKTLNTYYKYGPTPDNPINHWYEFLHDGQTGANINGNVITLHFVDGMKGDDDLTTKGTISDIGAPGVLVDSGDGGDNDSPVVNGSGGGGGGCFISTVADVYNGWYINN